MAKLRSDSLLIVMSASLQSHRKQISSADKRSSQAALLPQPTDDPHDPLNWPWTTRHLILFTAAWGALCPDWTSASGPTTIFPQAEQWHMSPNRANSPNAHQHFVWVLRPTLYGNAYIFANERTARGIGGLFWVPVSSFWGRAPVTFWTSVLGLAVIIGSATATTYPTYFAMRALTNFFLTAGQTMNIALLKDVFFFHERARKIGLSSALYIASPFLCQCLSNFVIYKTGHWPDVYWLDASVIALQIIFIVTFIDETWYNSSKHLDEQPARGEGLLGRLNRLLGIWQLRHHRECFPEVLPTLKRFAMIITRSAFFFFALS